MAHTVIGIFDYTNAAQSAVDYLERNGFSRENIDITQRANTTETRSDDDDNDFGEGISNFFSRLFGQSNDDARKYTEASRRGSMVTVYARTSEEAERAARIMDEYGAVDVDERSSQYSHAENYGGTTREEHSSHTANPTTGTSTTETKGIEKIPVMGAHPEMTNPHVHAENVGGTPAHEKTIPVIKEELEVGKKVVETGTTKLRSRIVEQPTEEHIRLRTEKVNIERTPVDRPATSDDISNFKENTIEVTEHKEVPVVNKDTRVVEEISLNKDVDERDETISDTVRKTEIDIDKDDNESENRRRSEDFDKDSNI